MNTDSSFDIVNTKPGRHDLKKLKQVHHEIALLAVLGYGHKQIAEKLDVTPVMVSYTLESTLVKKKLEILRGARDHEALDVRERLRELAPLSLDELEQLMLHPNTKPEVKRDIAQDFLDRAGFSPVHKTANVNEALTTDDINEIKDLARQNGMVSRAEDAEFEEVDDSGHSQEKEGTVEEEGKERDDRSEAPDSGEEELT